MDTKKSDRVELTPEMIEAMRFKETPKKRRLSPRDREIAEVALAVLAVGVCVGISHGMTKRKKA